MRRRIQIFFSSIFIVLLTFERCAYNEVDDKFDCRQTTLEIDLDSRTNVTNCRSIDGTITVVARGGLEPYDFSINGGDYQTNPVFTDLGAGTYTVQVKDLNGCMRSIDVTIDAAGSTLAAAVQTSADSECETDNGTAKITATGGVPPYRYQINSMGYSEETADPITYTDLKEGQYIVVVKDHEECQQTLSVIIDHGNTGVSYANEIKRIINTNCAKSGCHDAGAGSRDWTDYEKVKSHAQNIKTRTGNRTMPPDVPLNEEDIQRIACWVDDGAPEN